MLPALFDVLSPYRQAIESLQPEDAFRRESAQDQLARHLMVITLGGELSTEPPDHWLTLFFDHASPVLRQAAIRWVARILEFSEEESEDLLQRAKALFDWRLSRAAVAPASERDAFSTELAGIGAWAHIKGLGGTWFVARVQAVLARGGPVEHVDEVARTLPALTGIHPGQALALLASLAPQLTPYRLEKFGRPVVAAALADEDAREAAQAYIHENTMAGDYDLMDLLDDQPI